MKKILLIAIVLLGLMSSQAQTTVQGSKFSDNWSIGVKGGVASPFNGGSYWKGARGVVGVDLRKQVTPVFGLGLEAGWGINTSRWYNLPSPNTFDDQYLGVYGAVNFMNAFGGYKGAPRLFELEGVAGTGWLHSFYPKSVDNDGNTWGTRAGLNFNFNFGCKKQWTVSLMPRMLWNMGAHTEETNRGMSAIYDSNFATFEVTAGVTYHFGNSNGTHSFVVVQPYDQDEIDALNSEINRLRAELANCEAGNDACKTTLAAKERELEECLSQSRVQTVVRDLNNIRYIFFNVGSSVIQASQRPNIWMLAKTVKENKGARIQVLGYASQDGSLALNKVLAEKRAQAVKKALVKEGVAAGDIDASGEGIGHLFDTNNWNRVAKCTVILPE